MKKLFAILIVATFLLMPLVTISAKKVTITSYNFDTYIGLGQQMVYYQRDTSPDSFACHAYKIRYWQTYQPEYGWRAAWDIWKKNSEGLWVLLPDQRFLYDPGVYGEDQMWPAMEFSNQLMRIYSEQPFMKSLEEQSWCLCMLPIIFKSLTQEEQTEMTMPQLNAIIDPMFESPYP